MVTLRRGSKAAAGEVETTRDQEAHWSAELAATRAELADLMARAGDEALDVPDAATALPKQMRDLRDRIKVSEQAAAKATTRRQEAERALLVAEADAVEPDLRKARHELQAFDAKTADLLGALNVHTGRDYQPIYREPNGRERLDLLDGPTRAGLFDLVARLERRRDAMLAVAGGQDPFQSVDGLSPEDLPPLVWGPGALLPLPSYSGRVTAAAGAVEAAEQALADAEQAISAFHDEHPDLDIEGTRPLTLNDLDAIDDRTPEQRAQWRLLVARDKQHRRVQDAQARMGSLIHVAVR